jgi:GTPase Era involved in 16S rRNA processing
LAEDIRPNVDVNFTDILFISAREGTNISELKNILRLRLDEHITLQQENKLATIQSEFEKSLQHELNEHTKSGTWV